MTSEQNTHERHPENLLLTYFLFYHKNSNTQHNSDNSDLVDYIHWISLILNKKNSMSLNLAFSAWSWNLLVNNTKTEGGMRNKNASKTDRR